MCVHMKVCMYIYTLSVYLLLVRWRIWSSCEHIVFMLPVCCYSVTYVAGCSDIVTRD